MQKLTRSFLLAGAALGLAACGDDVSVTPPTPAPAAVVTAVTVSPASISIAKGQTVVATAQVSVSSGSGTVDKTVAWSSADATIASVGAATGAITGVNPGTTTIRATAGGVTGAATVTVTLGVQSVSVTPSSIALQVGQKATPTATVTRDAGVAGTVSWTSSNAAVASVNATTGEITGVAVGTTSIIAASTVDASKTAALSVVVSAVPNTLQAFSVAPTSANLGVGGSVKIVPNATTTGGAAVTYAFQTSNAAVATVDTAGKVTAVGNGTAIITTTASTSTNSLSASTTINVASASVSIASITQSGLGNPVDITNVGGQIEVTMNIAAGNQTLDSVRVTLGGQPAATQTFTVNGAPNAPVTLSINTAAYKINADSSSTVSFLNGTTGVQAQLFTQGTSGPTASNTITITLNNSDTFHARWALPSNTATASNGFLWYGGATTLNVIPVIYSGNTVSSATFGLFNCSSAAVTDASAPFVATFSCATTQNSNVSPFVSASLFAAGNPGPTSPNFANSPIASVRIDNVGPSGSFALTGAAPNNWIGGPTVASSNWYQYVSGVTDGGVGAKDSSAYVFQYADAPDTTWTNHVANPSNVPENATDFTNSAYNDRVQLFDKLGNRTIVYLGGGSTPGAQAYGVDVTAPTLDYLTATQQPLVVLPATDTLGNTKILNDLVNVTGGINSTNGLFGVRMSDTRSGFDVLAGGTTSGLFKKIARLGLTGSSCALGGTSCAYVRDTAIVDASNVSFRRDTVHVYGSLTATTPGYYTYSAYAVDRAGNTSSTITKQIAIDITAPLITQGSAVPAILTGGQPLTLVPTGLDDLEVWKTAAYLTYPNLPTSQTLHFPYSVFPAVGTPFDNVLASPVGLGGVYGASGVTLPLNFLRSLDVVQADSSAPVALSPTGAPTQFGNQFYDIKRSSTAFAAATPDSSGIVYSNVSPGLVPAGALFSAAAVGKWYVLASGTSGSTIQAQAFQATVTQNAPFQQVAFFRLTGGAWTYLGVVNAVPGTNPNPIDNGNNRTWTYTLTGVAPSLASTQQIIAVGMSAAGDALATLVYTVP